MNLNPDNYFSTQAAQEYMSNSQFKAFLNCSAAAMAELNGEYEPFSKDAFIEGHFFEALVCGDEELFYMQHPEIVSSKGATKGQPKANFIKVIEAAETVKRQPEIMEIINRCEKQKIVTGMINGVPYKGAIDLYDPVTGDCWDTKCMRNFESIYSPEEGRRLEWWEHYGYHRQAAIYRELCRQNFSTVGRFGLIAATKETVPDVAWLQFDSSILDAAFDMVYEMSPSYQAIKVGIVGSSRCGVCDYCKMVKHVAEPTIISQHYTEEENAE